ncbi:aminopeptidase P family protein [Kitasatospora indigofera]|uniref:aminopeptidase P family protein n=1 Tax=Kitasatospora indigofera TaxID=67307 RepID=UPI003661B566
MPDSVLPVRTTDGAARSGKASPDARPAIKQRKNGLWANPSARLVSDMKTGWAPPPESVSAPPIGQAAHTARRRAMLSARFPRERLVIPAGTRKKRSNDIAHRFRAATEYAYLTGDQTEGGVLIFEPLQDGGHEQSLYLPGRSSRASGEFWLDGSSGELWTGRRRSLADTSRVLGIACRDVKVLAEALLGTPAPVRVVPGHDMALEVDLADQSATAHNDELAEVLSEMRLVKDDFEITELQSAVDSTIRGFEDVVRSLDRAEATSERYVEGTFFLRARVEGNDIGYNTICAAGANACTLHWSRNDGPVRRGDLLLLDAGVETRNLYTADITRTLPVDGRFTAVQRRVYDAVCAAQEAALAVVRAGARYRDIHEAAQRVLAEHLIAWGIVREDTDTLLALDLQRRWTLHGTGHMLGMDVHDCAGAPTDTYVDGTLEPGMCLTVEPGLYFQPDDLTVPEEYRGIGVRIEDDIVVTADGHRNLSAALPRHADDIEAWMASLRTS